MNDFINEQKKNGLSAIQNFEMNHDSVAGKSELEDRLILDHFDGKPGFKASRLSWTLETTALFCRLARDVHIAGLDWYHVGKHGQIRFGRKEKGKRGKPLAYMISPRTEKTPLYVCLFEPIGDLPKGRYALADAITQLKEGLEKRIQGAPIRPGYWPDEFKEEEDVEESEGLDDIENPMLIKPSVLNSIYYGPPGTGKTFVTIDAALQIVDPEFFASHSELPVADWKAQCERRLDLKKRFDELSNDGLIRFVTFHQSFSYEDFVEGLRAVTNKEKQLEYLVEPGVFKLLCEAAAVPDVDAHTRKPHVLIIDEINRGNISRIFGELITLIEPSKRAGADEALEVTLPYSKKPFSVPSNVYLIGTMNTADRSLAGLDIALRRRFTFKEMPPKPELLDDINVSNVNEANAVNIGQMLCKMNERIEVLLDRDHCLGHAYFMPLKNDNSLEKLKFIFRQQILPLLEEYFFEDWERIAWVLNDQNKNQPEHRFLKNISADLSSLSNLFGDTVTGSLQDRRWHINEDAFGKIESYRGILGATA